jgi:hypothetical protein
VFTNNFGSFDGKNGIPTIRRPPVFIAMSRLAQPLPACAKKQVRYRARTVHL